MIIALTLGVLLGAFDQDPTPNYASRLLSPFEMVDVAPRLIPARRDLPVRVAVIADPRFVTDERLGLVRRACSMWSAAVGGGMTFSFVGFRRPGDADVVFGFCRSLPGRSLRGLALERSGFAEISLAVEDDRGSALNTQEIIRVAAHEMGHALGIYGHSPDSADIMSVSPTSAGVTQADVNTLLIAYR